MNKSRIRKVITQNMLVVLQVLSVAASLLLAAQQIIRAVDVLLPIIPEDTAYHPAGHSAYGRPGVCSTPTRTHRCYDHPDRQETICVRNAC